MNKDKTFGYKGKNNHSKEDLENMLEKVIQAYQDNELEVENLNMLLNRISRSKTKESVDNKLTQGKHLLRQDSKRILR